MVAVFSRHRELSELRDSLIAETTDRIPNGYVWHIEYDSLIGKRVFNEGCILEFIIYFTEDGGLYGKFRSVGIDLTNLHPDLTIMEMTSGRGAGAIWSWLMDAEGSNFANISGFNSH
jgi:hypothetical protein